MKKAIQLIIINGMGGSGKSTFIAKCANYCKAYEHDVDVIELSTVDYVKQVAATCGWNGGKTAKDRIFLSDLKKALAKWNNSPLEYVFEEINNNIKENKNSSLVFFINSREPNDIDIIYNMANSTGMPIMKLLVVNPNSEVNEVPELIDGIKSIKYDTTIHNSGDLKDLDCLAGIFMKEILSNMTV